jgi:hypothetical protein
MNAYATVAQIQCIGDRGGQAAVGDTHEIAYVDLPPICAQPDGKLLSATMLNDHDLLKYGENFFNEVPLNAYFQCASNAPTLKFKNKQSILVIYFSFRNIPVKLSRNAKQHPSNSDHLIRHDLCGVCRYMVTNSSLLLTSEPNSRRVPRVGQAHTQPFQTPPST